MRANASLDSSAQTPNCLFGTGAYGAYGERVNASLDSSTK